MLQHAEEPTAPRALSPDDSLLRLAQQTLQRQLDQLLGDWPGPVVSPTNDAIHKMRIAIRRLRVALRLFADFTPAESVHFRTEFRWINHSLGSVRDWDVLADSVAAPTLLPPSVPTALREYIEEMRANAREALAVTLASPRCAKLLRDFVAFTGSDPPPRVLRRWGSLSIASAVTLDIKRSVKRVRKLGRSIDDDSSPEALHRLRIRAKRLRYEAEIYEPFQPSLEAIARAAKQLQDLLGTHRDALHAGAELRRYLEERGLRSTADERAVLLELVAVQQQLAANARRNYGTAWRRFEKAVRRKSHC
jgi:CHAD domain-containing protein